MFATDTLPWACRIVEFGQQVQILGTKQHLGICVKPASQASTVLPLLRSLFAPVSPPTFERVPHFLALSLMNPNWHPTLLWGYYVDRPEPYIIPPGPIPPLYTSISDKTIRQLENISCEVLAIVAGIHSQYPTCALECVVPLVKWMSRAYAFKRCSDLKSMLVDNPAYQGLAHPLVQLSGNMSTLDFQSRYFTEDVPCGLVVTKGLADLVHVSTPALDQVIFWAQAHMGKEYLTLDGKLEGRDLDSTTCPQKYGFHDLKSLMSKNSEYLSQ